VIVYHFTWLCEQSPPHRWGSPATPSGDQSRNNPWVAALTFVRLAATTTHAFLIRPVMLRPAQIDLNRSYIRLLRPSVWPPMCASPQTAKGISGGP